MLYLFESCSLDTDRRELRRGTDIVSIEPQVFDLLHFLIQNRARVVSKDDLIAAIWGGRVVSESALSSRMTAVRQAIGDSGEAQRLIRTFARKGVRFVGEVREQRLSPEDRDAMPVPPGRGKATATALAASSVGPERRQVTVLACDVIADTGRIAKLDPEDLGDLMSAAHARIREAIEPHDGFVGKFMADGALIYFGYPQAHENDAERAVRAALAIVGAASDSQPPRIGIATGPVVVGDFIAGATTEPGVAGETPHLAARLRDLADPGTVVISADTRRLVGGLFHYSDIGLKRRPGVQPAAASRVVRDSLIGSRFEALRSVGNPLVGRAEELELLLRRWGDARSGEGRIVLVCGEPGIGKSRLVTEIQAAIADDPHSCLRFYCAPHRTQTALHPIVNQVERAARFEPADDDLVKLDKLERLLASVQPSDQDNALFADLLSIPAGGRYAAPPLSPQRRKELLLERFVARLAALAARQPVLILLEDMHWVDPTTRELFDMLIDRVHELPVLMIITYRPEFSPPWIGLSHVTTLTLNRLGRRDNAALIKELTGGKEIPAALLEQIIDRTDGVPLFVEELTKSLLESGTLKVKNDAYVAAGPLPALAVPATLQASLIARFDRLAPERTVVQTGAALGREFSYRLLKAVAEINHRELKLLLDQLVSSGLVHQRGSVPDALYTFKHALVQDAAHATLIKRQRIQLHRRITTVLEEEFPETPLRNPDVLAYHCTEAELWEKAIDYGIKAARVALHRSAGVEAQAQVEKATTLLQKVADAPARRQLEGRLQLALGDTLVMTRGFASPDVAVALSRGGRLLEESRHPLEAMRAISGLSNYHLMRSEAPKALKLIEPFLRRKLDAPRATIAQFLAGAAQLHIGGFREARRHLESSLRLYEEASLPIAFITGYHLRSFTLVWLGLALLYIGAIEKAGATIAIAVKDARSHAHPFTLVSALLALARFLNHQRDHAGAMAATEEGYEIATEQRSPYHISRASILRAVNLIEGDRPEEGAELMHSALRSHRDTGANFQSSFNLSHLALAYSKMGKFERALVIANQAIAEVVESGERWWEAEAQRIKGEILLAAASGRRDEAETCFRHALACARRQNSKFWELRAALSLAKSLHSAKGCAEARRILASICAHFPNELTWRDLADARDLLQRAEQPAL